MPIYEFHSPDTGKIYSFFAPTIKYSDLVPLCPEGASKKMVRLISGFSITGKQKEVPQTEAQSDQDPDDPFAGMDGEHANEIMKELESSIAGMDDENPDPRQMGSLMRKMCELSGETMDEPMEEVVRKLEEGMSPEDLEDRMGEFKTIATGGLSTLFSQETNVFDKIDLNLTLTGLVNIYQYNLKENNNEK